MYNAPFVLRFDRAIDAGCLRASLTEVVRRHEALRTLIRTTDGAPSQTVIAPPQLSMPVIDLRRVPAVRRGQEVDALVGLEAMRPFDLGRDIPIRAALFHHDEDERLLLLTMHHVAFDDWSMRVLGQELAAVFRALSDGRSSPLVELPLQYADFACWQRAWLRSGAAEPHLRYWQDGLAGITPLFQEPSGAGPTPPGGMAGRTHSFVVPADLTRALTSLSRRERLTLPMTLLAAWTGLLGRWFGRDDVVVGVVTAGRTRLELEPLIGCFTNILMVRTDLSGKLSYRGLLQRVREAALEAYAHQEVPFEVLADQLHALRPGAPGVQATFNFHTQPPAPLTLSGVSATPIWVDTGRAKFDLTLAMEEADGRLHGGIEHRIDRFDTGAISDMVGQLQALLSDMVTSSDQRLVGASRKSPPDVQNWHG